MIFLEREGYLTYMIALLRKRSLSGISSMRREPHQHQQVYSLSISFYSSLKFLHLFDISFDIFSYFNFCLNPIPVMFWWAKLLLKMLYIFVAWLSHLPTCIFAFKYYSIFLNKTWIQIWHLILYIQLFDFFWIESIHLFWLRCKYDE